MSGWGELEESKEESGEVSVFCVSVFDFYFSLITIRTRIQITTMETHVIFVHALSSRPTFQQIEIKDLKISRFGEWVRP